MMIATTIDGVLSMAETTELAEAEAVIERGLETFVEVGQALARIRDGRLYRLTHGTFESYCEARWNLSRKRAYDVIGAATAVASLSQKCDTPPTTESHAAALAKVPEPERAEVWKEALEATNGKPTAKAVTEAAAKRKPGPEKADQNKGYGYNNRGGTFRRHAQIAEQIVVALSGLDLVVSNISVLDPTMTPEVAAGASKEIAEHIAALNKFNRLLKERAQS